MITARRSTATERRGVELPRRRPTVIPVAAISALLLEILAGCASVPPGALPNGTPLPSDEPAAHAQAAAALALQPSDPASCKPLNSPAGPAYATAADAETGMATQLTAGGPQIGLSPPQPAGSTRIPLEIISMPMWLWINAPCGLTKTADGHTILDQVVIQTANWKFGAGSGFAPISCTGTDPTHGAGIPYAIDYDPVHPVLPPGYNTPCIVTVPNQPAYATTTTAAGAPALTDGTVTLDAQVTWTVTFTVDDSDPAPVAGWNPPHGPVPAVQTKFRVGEIQALVTQS